MQENPVKNKWRNYDIPTRQRTLVLRALAGDPSEIHNLIGYALDSSAGSRDLPDEIIRSVFRLLMGIPVERKHQASELRKLAIASKIRAPMEPNVENLLSSKPGPLFSNDQLDSLNWDESEASLIKRLFKRHGACGVCPVALVGISLEKTITPPKVAVSAMISRAQRRFATILHPSRSAQRLRQLVGANDTQELEDGQLIQDVRQALP
jgi:hypothetical protein